MGSLRTTDPNDFLDSIVELIRKEVVKNTSQNPNHRNEKNPYLKMGKVDPNYAGTGRPGIVFPGDQSASSKKYPYLESYAPEANDYVLMAQTHGTWVILGKII